MKHLLLAVLISICGVVNAEEFKLTITSKDVIIHNNDDWVSAGQTDFFRLYVNKQAVASEEHNVKIYSVVEFYNPNKTYEVMAQPVSKIYTHGILNCEKAMFDILAEWFVDEKNTIFYLERRYKGSYLVDMGPENTSRYDLYRLVCNK